MHRSVLIQIEKVQLAVKGEKAQHGTSVAGNVRQRLGHGTGKARDVPGSNGAGRCLQHKQIGGRLRRADHVLDAGDVLNRVVIELRSGVNVEVALALKVVDELVGNWWSETKDEVRFGKF